MKFIGGIENPKDIVTKEFTNSKVNVVELSGVEQGMTATSPYIVGDYLQYTDSDGVAHFAKVTAAIEIGDTLAVGTNIESNTIGDALSYLDRKDITLTKAEYNALSTAEKNDPNKFYYITDAYATSVDIEDSVVAPNAVWSSQKIRLELDQLQGSILTKQPMLTFDNAPTAGSDNPVKSSGIKTSLDDKFSYLDNAVVGAKNLIDFRNTEPLDEETITLNSTGFTVSGSTAYAGSNTDLSHDLEVGKQYTLSANVTALSAMEPYLAIRNGSGDIVFGVVPTATGVYSFPFTYANGLYFSVLVNMATAAESSVTITNLMVRLASDTDSTFVPYAMTNRRLTQRCDAIETELNTKVDVNETQVITAPQTFTERLYVDRTESTTSESVDNVLVFKYEDSEGVEQEVAPVRYYDGDSEEVITGGGKKGPAKLGNPVKLGDALGSGTPNIGIVLIGSDLGTTVITAGESAPAVIAAKSISNSDNIYLIADGAVKFLVNAQTPANVIEALDISATGEVKVNNSLVIPVDPVTTPTTNGAIWITTT